MAPALPPRSPNKFGEWVVSFRVALQYRISKRSYTSSQHVYPQCMTYLYHTAGTCVTQSFLPLRLVPAPQDQDMCSQVMDSQPQMDLDGYPMDCSEDVGGVYHA